MASIASTITAGFSYSKPRIERGTNRTTGASIPVRPRRVVLVRAEAQPINPEIRKNEEKVVDNVDIAEISKPVTAYCRCWRSGTFPLCDGSHMKHNKATGDNVGPLLLKKPK
ncbi:CDGSH iron-sulfur domain-containing protein NEET [Tripterygium wilfordii]|uniref:CDGSH iron-sulfur domain-containing protein NEET n=1 Tax=Tripterygium wilfordii TaxID=458696 RepID=UPI0018F833DE|nr:CDGSH iron-sulfur domain-containing protein NEET [Tripterygium wilfordii]